MSTPPITAWVPKVSAEPTPAEIHRLFTLAFQKLGNHATAFALQQAKINAIKPGTSTTIVESSGGGGGSVAPSTPGGIPVNNQSGQTSYTTASTDDGALIVLSDASAIAVSLTSQSPPWSCFITNQSALGGGTATLTPMSGTINGVATLTVPPSYGVIVAFDGANWWASTSSGITQLTGDVTAGPGSGSQAATLKVAVAGWDVFDGSAGTNLGNIQSMLRDTSLSECFLTVTASDATTDLTFDIQQNGVSIFTSPPTVTRGAASGQQFAFPLKTVPLPVAKNDKFNLDITAGTSSWKVSLVVR